MKPLNGILHRSDSLQTETRNIPGRHQIRRNAIHPMAAGLVLLIGFGAGLFTPAFGAELFLNGSFEAGNTSFGTDLGFVANAPFGSSQNGVYSIATNPSSWLSSWANMGDHTTGSGQMLLATPNPGNARTWFESINVTAGLTYTFSGWAAHVDIPNPNVANLSINVQGTSLGNFNLATLSQGTWGQFSFNYTALSTGALVFSITDLAGSNNGNDFVLDDLSLTQVPEPASAALFGLGVVGLAIYRRRK